MPQFGSMADVAMESEGKAAGGRVTCSCGGGAILQGTFFLMRQALGIVYAEKKLGTFWTFPTSVFFCIFLRRLSRGRNEAKNWT